MEKIVIIGGGPAGLASAIYASRAMLNPLVLEGEPGGQLMQTSDVENYPGFSKPILGPVLMKEFRDQALRFGTRIESDLVSQIEKKDGYITLHTNSGKQIDTKSILITTGASAKWLGLESETKLRGAGVSACATCDGFFFKDKDIVVVGGGDSAMEEALFLTRFAKSVKLIHRRDTFRASQIMQERVLKHPKIEVVLNSEIIEILGDDKVVGVKVKTGTTVTDIPCEGVFIAIGHSPSTSFLKDSGVMLDEKGYIYTRDRVDFERLENLKTKFNQPYRYSTNIAGIFAAGDCTDHEYRQAGTAVGMGIAATLEIQKFLETNQ